jgi:hypothetical protein
MYTALLETVAFNVTGGTPPYKTFGNLAPVVSSIGRLKVSMFSLPELKFEYKSRYY